MTSLSVSNGGLKLIEVVVRLQTGSWMIGIEWQERRAMCYSVSRFTVNCHASFHIFLGGGRCGPRAALTLRACGWARARNRSASSCLIPLFGILGISSTH
jgi:hypothetical protein